jgi:hypothetical protein
VRVAGHVSNNGRPFAEDVVVDAAGNSYVSGRFGGTVQFGSTILSAGNADTYVAKLDAAGRYRWVVSLRTSARGAINNVLALDANGTVYVGGCFTTPTLTLGATTLVNNGGSDLFLAKLDSSGTWLAAARAGGVGDETVSSLAVDSNGAAFLSGQFTATAVFGTTVLTSAGGSDVFVACLPPSGSWRWAVGGGSPVDDWSGDVGLDALGHAYWAGVLRSAGGQVGTLVQPAATDFVGQLDASTGAILRLTTFGGSLTTTRTSRLAITPTGECYVGGSYLGQLRFGSTVLTSLGAGVSNDDVFIAKLDAAGTWQWARSAGGTSGEFCTGLAVDARHNVYLAGYYRGPGSQFGPTRLVAQNTTLFFSDVFVAKLDASGTWRWAISAAGAREDICTRLVLGPHATPTLVGDYSSASLTFAPVTIPGDPNFVPSAYLARLSPNELTIRGDSLLCAGGTAQLTAATLATAVSWRWNTGATTARIQVTTPGIYTVTATFPGGYSLSEQFRVRLSSLVPTVQISGGGFLCPGTPRQLTALAPGAAAVSWSTGATTPTITITQPGTYSVVASYSSACSVSAQTNVSSNELRISGRAQLCPGQSALLTATTTGSAVTQYRWSTGATTPTLLVSQAGSYQLTATLADGCQLTASHIIGPPLAKVASVSGDTLLCPSSTLTLTALNPDALTYQWTTGATTPTIPVTQPGLYGVLLTYAGGCSSRDSLQVLAAPLALGFTLGADTTLCAEASLLLHAPASSGPGLQWRWSDGSTGPTLQVTTAGTYSLALTTPCSSRTLSRTVAYTSCLFIPNVVTPNNDQRNDRFVIQGLLRGDWALTLYNRWGRPVYDAPVYHHDWGGDAEAGVYYYFLRHVSTSTTYKGWLEVIR